MLILGLLLYSMLVLVASIAPKQSSLSDFELRRRSKNGDAVAIGDLHRMSLLGGVLALQRITEVVLIALFALAMSRVVWGELLAIIAVLFFIPLTHATFVRRYSMRYYERYEPVILRYVHVYRSLIRHFGSLSIVPAAIRVHSPDELVDVVRHALFLSAETRKLMENSATFLDRRVVDIMTSRTSIRSVARDELLGPLVLDDLHKTGHSIFPVIDGDIDRIVGLLDIQAMLALQTKQSVAAAVAMSPQVIYVDMHMGLREAVEIMLDSRQSVVIVRDDVKKVVGLMTLRDATDALFGVASPS